MQGSFATAIHSDVYVESVSGVEAPPAAFARVRLCTHKVQITLHLASAS